MSYIDEFNNTTIMFLDYIYSLTNDHNINFYKKSFNKIIQSEKQKLIEQFIIHCLIYKEYIDNKNISFFKNFDAQNDKDSLFNKINIKQILEKCDNSQNNLLFDYLILLCNFSTEYLRVYSNI